MLGSASSFLRVVNSFGVGIGNTIGDVLVGGGNFFFFVVILRPKSTTVISLYVPSIFANSFQVFRFLCLLLVVLGGLGGDFLDFSASRVWVCAFLFLEGVLGGHMG